jgi:hypothetical protein
MQGSSRNLLGVKLRVCLCTSVCGGGASNAELEPHYIGANCRPSTMAAGPSLTVAKSDRSTRVQVVLCYTCRVIVVVSHGLRLSVVLRQIESAYDAQTRC